jgi:hypothetical protein
MGAGVYVGADRPAADGAALAADRVAAGFFALTPTFFVAEAFVAPFFFACFFMEANPTARLGGPSTAGPFLDTPPAGHLQ